MHKQKEIKARKTMDEEKDKFIRKSLENRLIVRNRLKRHSILTVSRKRKIP